MVKMYKAEIQGLGKNPFVSAGVWLTRKELDSILERQYDDTVSDKVVNLGGRYFKPKDFRGVVEEKELAELARSGSPLFDSKLIESLAKMGYLGEIVKNCPTGYRRFVSELVESGRYKIESGEPTNKVNQKKLEKLNKMKGDLWQK